MSEETNPIINSKIFTLIVDNEVAGNLKVPNIPGTEKMIAIFQSDPTIVENSEEIPEGYIWDGTSFNPPA